MLAHHIFFSSMVLVIPFNIFPICLVFGKGQFFTVKLPWNKWILTPFSSYSWTSVNPAKCTLPQVDITRKTKHWLSFRFFSMLNWDESFETFPLGSFDFWVWVVETSSKTIGFFCSWKWLTRDFRFSTLIGFLSSKDFWPIDDDW